MNLYVYQDQMDLEFYGVIVKDSSTQLPHLLAHIFQGDFGAIFGFDIQNQVGQAAGELVEIEVQAKIIGE